MYAHLSERVERHASGRHQGGPRRGAGQRIKVEKREAMGKEVGWLGKRRVKRRDHGGGAPRRKNHHHRGRLRSAQWPRWHVANCQLSASGEQLVRME